MKYITYLREQRKSIGVWDNGKIFDISGASRSFGNRVMPDSMIAYIQDFEMNHRLVEDMFNQSDPATRPELFFPDGQAELIAPLNEPKSIRNFSAYAQHRNVMTDHFALDTLSSKSFIFGNHQLVSGANAEIHLPEGISQLDFEVQIGAVICRQGSDLNIDTYQDYIAGFLIHTQLIARDLQSEELSSGHGMAKCIDLTSVSGPYLANKEIFPTFRRKDVIEDEITILLNGDELSFANTGDMDIHFGEILAEASRNSIIYPGDIITTGALPGGSLLGAGKDHFLAAGDTIRVTSNELGEQKIRILE